MNEHELLSLLLPEGLLDYFVITGFKKDQESYILYLEESKIPPEEHKDKRLQSKGFYEPITIQDFPLRGKACYLKVKRRRWTDLDTGDIISRNWDVVAKGTRMTSEFAAFLKEINRY